MPETEPSFNIGTIPVYGDLILAPMDGYSDWPFRSLARELGSAMSYTEFLNAIEISGKKIRHAERLKFEERERPVVFQILDNDADRIVKAAVKLMAYNPDVLDVNLGCCARDVSNRGAGAGLLRQPEKIAEIITKLVAVVPQPVTAKIRLGWDDSSRNYREIAHILEDSGAKMIAVHGRTRDQAYNGSADWDAIAEVKAVVKVPVIGNGDVSTVADIERMKQHTGCDAVMIGRAAITNPWIFSRIDRDQVSNALLRKTMEDHLNRCMAFYGEEYGLKTFRKFAARYLKPVYMKRSFREFLLTRETATDFWNAIDSLLSCKESD